MRTSRLNIVGLWLQGKNDKRFATEEKKRPLRFAQKCSTEPVSDGSGSDRPQIQRFCQYRWYECDFSLSFWLVSARVRRLGGKLPNMPEKNLPNQLASDIILFR